MASVPLALRRTFAWRSVRRSLAVAVVIGTVLNAINQGSELLSGHWPVWWKLILTYCVPFAVASYGSYAAFRSSGEEAGDRIQTHSPAELDAQPPPP